MNFIVSLLFDLVKWVIMNFMKIAVFPGSFDPPTYGHLNVIERASRLFDSIDVLVSVNPEKSSLFSAEERVAILEQMTSSLDNVTVHAANTLVVEYARKVGAKVLLRGIRNANDFSYEFDLALVNHSLDDGIETLFVPTEQKYFTIRSSAIKELARYGGDVSKMVPPVVEEALKKKFAKGT